MEKQYMDIPNESPDTGRFYCPWCAADQQTHLKVFTVVCSNCGRTLEHDGKRLKVPEMHELKACSEEQLEWMLRKVCIPTKNAEFARRIALTIKNRPDVVFEAAEMMCGLPHGKDVGWSLIENLADENYYDALAMLYNKYFTDDLRYRAQLEKYSELLVREHGDQTAADTLRTILKKDGRLY